MYTLTQRQFAASRRITTGLINVRVASILHGSKNVLKCTKSVIKQLVSQLRDAILMVETRISLFGESQTLIPSCVEKPNLTIE
jgi:hypothetical protein